MGRSAIYMVMGMTFIFLFFGKTMSDSGTEAFSNAIDYYESTQTYNIAEAGANLACNQIFMNSNWRTGFTNVAMNDGRFTVTVDTTTYVGKVLLTSTGIFQQDTHVVRILLSPSSIAKFAMYSGNVSAAAKLRSGDTVDGPIHFNNKLVTQGNPVFTGKATMGSLQTTSGTPTFLGGYQEGVNVSFPSYSSNAASIASDASTSGGTNNYKVGGEMWLRFSVVAGVGMVEYKTNSGAAWGAPVNITTFAPNGKIAIVNGALHVQGTVKGEVTITSTVSPSSTTPTSTVGATYIDGNLQYNTDPLTNPSSTDKLGLVSAGDITINTLPIRMDGAYFTNTKATLGGTLANTNPSKQLKIVGSLITREINSTDFGTGATKGAKFYMKYDNRFEDDPPEDFPNPTVNNSFEVLSWFE
ncbi:MAG: hypothetical protein HUU02_03345 [Bacteroidetes bacterium]|nr:hypothetical protein [Bacteroidota bacterium]